MALKKQKIEAEFLKGTKFEIGKTFAKEKLFDVLAVVQFINCKFGASIHIAGYTAQHNKLKV
jgi:hypothetical protein